jgi:AraC-like DNA-binding protein
MELRSHAVLSAVNGGLRVVVDDRERSLQPGQIMLIEPPATLTWRLSQGAGFELLIFDICWRPRHQSQGSKWEPDDQWAEIPLSQLWQQPVPELLPSGLTSQIDSELRALGDLWWRGTSERHLADARLGVLLARLHAQLSDHGNDDDDPLAECLRWASERLEQGLGVADLARRTGMSRGSFSKAFTARFGRPPGTLLRDLRLNRSRELLETNDLSVDQVALHCGWRSRPAFASCFARCFGAAPALWREQHRRLADEVVLNSVSRTTPKVESLLIPKR